MYIFTQKIVVLALSIVLMFVFVVKEVEAVVFFFDAADMNIGISGEVEISLFIDTEGEKINAMEGIISFPYDSVNIIDINEANSVIDIWLEKPKITQEGIIFSGIVPGGFDVVHDPIESKEKPGKVLTFILQSKVEGRIPIILKDAVALRNDGSGSQANISLAPFSLEVSGFQGTKLEGIVRDTELPEQFFPEIVQDKDIFNGKYFLIFQTQDKSSGIDHYEISENEEEWVVASSPYILKDQLLQSVIKVKALDKLGNERVVELPKTYPQASKYHRYLWGIIIVLGAVYLFLIKRKDILNIIRRL